MPDYGSQIFRDWYVAFVNQFLATYGTMPIGGFWIDAGVSGEAANVYRWDCSSKQAEFEKQVSCTEYIEFAELAIRTWAAGSRKPMRLPTNLQACDLTSAWRDLLSAPPLHGICRAIDADAGTA